MTFYLIIYQACFSSYVVEISFHSIHHIYI